MATRVLLVLTQLIVALTCVTSPAAASGCDTSQLIPCLPAARANPEPPSSQCCSLIHTITSECLCAALQSTVAKIEGVDIKTALQLPHKCGKSLPKGTKCGDVSVPTSMTREGRHMERTEDDKENPLDGEIPMEQEMEHPKMEKETMKDHEEQKSVNKDGMEHTMKPQMENGMEH
ncbi:hypothetical protein R1sor_019539 [Riccia sorocarpa]|uniref:Bifunctional inhibitor/plant lipid transfer protein/seed storage helical domain-containing protein n=1 Tax=Riccia sorocarpa TaxID=122646 RepID=A0ABD3IH32_9MARC